MDNVKNSKLQERLEAIKASAGNAEFKAPEETKIVDDNDINTIANQLMNSEPTKEESQDPDVIVAKSSKATPAVTIVEDDSKPTPIPQVGDELFELDDLDKKNEELSKELHEKQKAVEEEGIKRPDEASDPEDEVDSIINGISNTLASVEEDKEYKSIDDMTLEEKLKEYEASKLFSEYDRPTEHTGPAEYIIETDDEYSATVGAVLEQNNIKFAKVNGSDKIALLNRYTNSGDKITLTLPNSGIYVQFSGAGTEELISMSTIQSDSPMSDVLNKLYYVNNHIVNTSVGPMKLQQLLDIISHNDIETLFYGLFAATHPDEVELSRTCDKCGGEYFVKMATRDILLNQEDYKKSDEDIRNNVTTYKRLLESSKLSKVYKQAIGNGMIIFYKHPSIKTYLVTYYHLSEDTIKKYPRIVDMAFDIDKIAIKDNTRPGDQYIEYTDPNEIITIISRIKNPDYIYEIVDLLMGIRPAVEPVYGFRECKCPHCGSMNGKSKLNVSDLLFTVAREEDNQASMRRAVKEEQMKREKSQNNV